MHCNRIGNDYLTQHILISCLSSRPFLLTFSRHCHCRSPHCNPRLFTASLVLLHGNQSQRKNRQFPIKDRNIRHKQRIKPLCPCQHIICHIGRSGKILILGITLVHSLQRNTSCISVLVRRQFINPVLFIIQNTDLYTTQGYRIMCRSGLHHQITNCHISFSFIAILVSSKMRY